MSRLMLESFTPEIQVKARHDASRLLIPATWEEETGRMAVRGQPQQNVKEASSQSISCM
jgi:hypothetical protein